MMGNGTELHEGRWQAESCRALGASLGGLGLGWLADFVLSVSRVYVTWWEQTLDCRELKSEGELKRQTTWAYFFNRFWL